MAFRSAREHRRECSAGATSVPAVVIAGLTALEATTAEAEGFVGAFEGAFPDKSAPLLIVRPP
eukprot:6243151-Pyramimonas_sp.AAC.1